MREIGLALGVVESRVSQVHASAVMHLRSALRDLTGSGVLPGGRLRKPSPRREARLASLAELGQPVATAGVGPARQRLDSNR